MFTIGSKRLFGVTYQYLVEEQLICFFFVFFLFLFQYKESSKGPSADVGAGFCLISCKINRDFESLVKRSIEAHL